MRTCAPLAALLSLGCAEQTTLANPIPSGRSFHLGFAWQPYDWNEAAFAETGRLIAENGDMIGIFFDGSVPWQEALDKQSLHPVQEAEIEKRLGFIQDHQKILPGLNFLVGDRVSLALNLAEDEEPRTGKWNDKTFDDPEVLEAYLNYCRYMLSRFKSLLAAIKQIYPTLKSEYPNLPLMLEFMLENDEESAKRAEVTRQLLPYSDYYAVSTYPFQLTGADPAEIPRNWFRRAKTIAPDKPFAVVETNWLAESFYHPTQGIPVPFHKDKLLIPSDERLQAGYIDLLLSEADALDAEFVMQWNIRDLDQLDALLTCSGGAYDGELHPFMRLATDCGLIDQDGVERPGLAVWRQWLAAPVR